MTPLWIEFITDKRGNCKFKFNERTIAIADIDELEMLFNIFLKHIRLSYEYVKLDMNDRLSVVGKNVNNEYPQWRETIGYIKEMLDKEVFK